MRVLIFGRTGQVARALASSTPDNITLITLGREGADLAQPARCVDAIIRHAPDLVINAAAYTAVDKAEEEVGLARLINGEAPAAMARATANQGVPLLHVSTDYVFDGSGSRPWRPDDPTGPLGIYGQSKLAGEDGVRAAGGTHAILRTSWVFSADGTNFVKTMLRQAGHHERLTVVTDQVGGPTAATDIADALWRMGAALVAGGGRSGTYHFTGAEDVSWADFAREIFARAGRTVTVEDIATSQYPTPARRPLNSRLECSDLETQFGIQRPDWRSSLSATLKQLKERTA